MTSSTLGSTCAGKCLFPGHYVLYDWGIRRKVKQLENNFELPINEVTILMGIGAIGIVTVISLFLYLAASAFFGNNK